MLGITGDGGLYAAKSAAALATLRMRATCGITDRVGQRRGGSTTVAVGYQQVLLGQMAEGGNPLAWSCCLPLEVLIPLMDACTCCSQCNYDIAHCSWKCSTDPCGISASSICAGLPRFVRRAMPWLACTQPRLCQGGWVLWHSIHTGLTSNPLLIYRGWAGPLDPCKSPWNSRLAALNSGGVHVC